MPVEAVDRRVQGAVVIPADMHVVRRVGYVLHLGIGFYPVDALAVFAPEFLGVLDGIFVHVFVLGSIDQGARGPLGGYRKKVVV